MYRVKSLIDNLGLLKKEFREIKISGQIYRISPLKVNTPSPQEKINIQKKSHL